MTEAELLELFAISRSQIDAAIAQTIALSFALIVGVYYFLWRSGLAMKGGVFILYAIGWYIFMTSISFAGQQMVGAEKDLRELVEKGAAGASTTQMLASLDSWWYGVYVVAVNAAEYLMLGVAFAVLFFWKPPRDVG